MFSIISTQCIWSFLFASLLNAAPAARLAHSVTRAELKIALARYQSIERLDVDFKQTKILKDLALNLESEGHLRITPPDHVEWKVTKPQPMTVELEQDKITIQTGNHQESFSQAQNPSAKDRKSYATLLTWLKLDADAILDKFDVSRMGPRKFRFTAKDKAEPMLKALEMELTPAGHVARLLFEEASGDEMRLSFQKPKVLYRQ